MGSGPRTSSRDVDVLDSKQTSPLPMGRYSTPGTKKPPGNRVAFSLGRIVPTEARPLELSWRHSMGALWGCQGQIIFTIMSFFSISYRIDIFC